MPKRQYKRKLVWLEDVIQEKKKKQQEASVESKFLKSHEMLVVCPLITMCSTSS